MYDDSNLLRRCRKGYTKTIRSARPSRAAALVLCLATIIATSARHAVSQWHDHGYITSSGDEVFVFNAKGEYRFANVAPRSFDIFDLVMDADDRQVLLVMRNQKRIVRFDPGAMSITGTLHSGPPFVRPEAAVVDQNGDYFVADSGANAVFKIARGSGTVSTIYVDARLDRIEGGMRIDPGTGDLLLLNNGVNDVLLRVSRDGRRNTVVGTGFQARFGFDVDIQTADIFSTACCWPPHLSVLYAGQSVATSLRLPPSAPAGYYAMRADRSTSSRPRMVVSPIGPDGGIWFVDVFGAAVTRLAVVGPPMFAIEHLHGRNVQPVRIEPGRWKIWLDFPDEPGLGYVVALSLSGNRPGFYLKDGRQINLAIDDVTRLTFAKEWPGFFWRNLHQLDTQGRGFANLDVRQLYSLLRGVRFFVQALTLDPSASEGIRTIADPVPLLIE